MATQQYPIKPQLKDDPRFTRGLVLDVMKVLAEHGYPVEHPLDMVDLQQTLYRFLYVGRGKFIHIEQGT